MAGRKDQALDLKDWIRKFFPHADPQERRDLIDLWERIPAFPAPDETVLPHEVLLQQIPSPEITQADMGPLIGSGSYATVHKISWNGESFAMKSFQRKIDALEELGLQHRLSDQQLCPHIVPAMAYTEIPRSNDAEQNRHSIIMELLDGRIDERTPGRTIDSAAEFAAADALEAMLQLARALQYMHSQKIMHRDVKPGNVLYRPKRQGDLIRGRTMIKLADFGTAHLCGGSYVHTANRGTKFYKAPEVIRDGDTCPYTYKADVYSFAMTCYKIGTGKTPLECYKNLSSKELYRKVAGRWGIVPGKRPKLDSDLVRVLKQCWHFTPEKRPPMKVVSWALEYLVGRAYV